MWEIFYEDRYEEFDNPTELLKKIKNLHLEYQSKQGQFVDIVLDRKAFIKIGLGDKFNRSMIFYHPYDASEDNKISFNSNINVKDKTKAVLFEPREAFNGLLERNLIDFDVVLNEVAFFLNEGALSDKVKMYAW